MNQILHLQNLCNRFGDFKVAIAKGDWWSKHVSVLSLWEKGDWDMLRRVTERQILEPEIVIDIDDEPIEKTKDTIVEFLDFLHLKYTVWKTGGRGYHIHLISESFVLYKKDKREQLRKMIIDFCGADVMKKSESMMISIENAPHRKTGIKKRLILSTENERDE